MFGMKKAESISPQKGAASYEHDTGTDGKGRKSHSQKTDPGYLKASCAGTPESVYKGRFLYSLQQPPDQTPLSRFYPFLACSAETEARVKEALEEARERRGELPDEEIQAIRERLEATDYTPEADRERLFTCFLQGWDFTAFKIWDWTGNRITAEEADRLRAYYAEKQKQYQDHPERFSPPALKADDDMSRYSPEVQQLLTTFDNLSD